MKDTVYIDVLFLINFVTDCLMVLAAGLLLKRKVKTLRLILAAAAGGLYSCGIFFIDMNFLYGNLVTLLFFLLVTYVVFGFHTLKSYIKSFFALTATGFIFGGMTLALYLFTGAGAVMTFNNGALYIDMPVFLFLAFAFGAYLVIWLITRLLSWFNPKDVLYELRIHIGEKTALVKSFVDTGNSLSDPFSGTPVIVAEFEAVKGVIPEALWEFFRKEPCGGELPELLFEAGWEKRFRLIQYSGVQVGGILPAFRPDKVTLLSEKGTKEAQDIIIAVTHKKLSDDGIYSALLSPKIVR